MGVSTMAHRVQSTAPGPGFVRIQAHTAEVMEVTVPSWSQLPRSTSQEVHG